MRKIALILSIIFISLFLVQCNSDRKALHQKLEEMAVNLNESAPVMLDQFTRFEKASVTSDNVFRYSYTVLNTTNPDSLVQRGLQALRENIGREFSLNPDLRIFKENKVTIEYIYNDEKGNTIRSLSITPEDYQ